MAEEAEENGKQNGQEKRSSEVNGLSRRLGRTSKTEYALAVINQATTSVELAATATSAAIVAPILDVLTLRQVDSRSHTVYIAEYIMWFVGARL